MADENMNTIHITEKQKVQEITDKLKHYFGFDSFKGDQEAIIRNLISPLASMDIG